MLSDIGVSTTGRRRPTAPSRSRPPSPSFSTCTGFARGTSPRGLVREAVVRTRLIEIALTGWDGGQAAANIAKLVEQARAFSARGGGGSARVRWLTDQRGTADTEDAGVSEITDEVVRLVTMHASKGPRYPIVALANLGSRGATRIEPVADRARRRLELRVTAGGNKFQTPGFEAAWTAEKAQLDAEELRLLYVAATRARDRLIIPVSKREKDKTPSSTHSLRPSPAPRIRSRRPIAAVCDSTRRSPEPLSDEPPEPSSPDVAAVSAALAERDAWIAADESTRSTAREELGVFPATRDEGEVDLSALMLAADDEPPHRRERTTRASRQRCIGSSS